VSEASSRGRDDSSKNRDSSKTAVWSDEEKLLYVKLLKRFGNDYSKFTKFFKKSKSESQIKNFYMNNKVKGLGFDKMIKQWESS